MPRASPLLVIQSLATLEIVQPVFPSDAAARLAGVEEGTPIVGDAALAALSAMWATIFQQQVLPDQQPAGQLTVDGISSIDSAEDATSSTNDLPIERAAEASASPKVIDLLCLLQGGGCGMQPQIPLVDAEQHSQRSAEIGSDLKGEAPAGLEPRTMTFLVQTSLAPSARSATTPQGQEQESTPVAGAELEAIQVPVVLAGPSKQEVSTVKPAEDAQDSAGVLPVTCAETATVHVHPNKKAKHLKTVVAASDCPAPRVQRREGQPAEDMPSASVADAKTDVAEVIQVPEHQSVVSFRKQIQEKANFEVAEVAQLFPAAPGAATSVGSEVRPQKLEQGTASTIAETPTEDACLASAEVKQGEVVPETPEASQPEPQTALKDCELPPAMAKQDSIAVQSNPPNATAGLREQAAVDSRQPAQAARRPNAPVEAEPSTSFAAFSSRESKTISIRIPLTDSTWKPGSPAAHIDLVFHQRNQDLTLQFRSPSGEIQRNLDESMPTLIDRLKNENWAVRPQDSPASVLPNEPSFDGRRRGDLFQTAAPVLETSRQIATQGQSGSQGFSFDDQTPNHNGSREQKQGRSRKREQVFQSEFDEQQQS